MNALHDVVAVEVVEHYHLRLTFDDGTIGDVDLFHLRERAGIFKALRDPAFFEQVSVDRDARTVVWPNGLDLDPEGLYELARPVDAAKRATSRPMAG